VHIEEPVNDVSLSDATRFPVSARRLSQKVLLVLLRGRMWVRDGEGRRRDLTGPTWVVWYPGESIEYGADGDTVHWLFAQPTGGVPDGAPRPGSLVRLGTEPVGPALLVQYLDDTPDRSGPVSVVADVPGSGIGIYALDDPVEVVEEADEDLNLWDFGPGIERPARRGR
jgi:hypothetical protein